MANGMIAGMSFGAEQRWPLRETIKMSRCVSAFALVLTMRTNLDVILLGNEIEIDLSDVDEGK